MSLGWPRLRPRYVSLMSSSLVITPFAKAAVSGVVVIVEPHTVASGSPRVRFATARAISLSGSS
jgi:hypothetical protein